MFTTTQEAKVDYNSIKKMLYLIMLKFHLHSIDNNDVEPTDDELNNYYSDHKAEYEQEASKDVDFVVYTVVPSTSDDAKTKEEITELISDFEMYDDYELMARRNSDNTNAKFTYAIQSELQDKQWKELFNAKKGTVTDPYLVNSGTYRIAKLVEVEFRPDSVKTRHILIKPTQTMSLDSVNKKINDIRADFEAGVDFGSLAKKHSEDQGSAIKGGDLGWFSEGEMVDDFNEACFSSKRGIYL